MTARPLGRYWRLHAACRDEDPELFYPVGNTKPARDQARQAQAVCRRCPVTQQCLEEALATPERDGVWGGTVPERRDRMLRASETSRG